MRFQEFRGVLRDLGAVLGAAPTVERGRLGEGPAALVGRLRQRGAANRHRSPEARARLRRVIHLVDRLFPRGGNCYRRALLEIAVDPDAAQEPLHLGLSRTGRPGSGHAWLDSMMESKRNYDVELSL